MPLQVTILHPKATRCFKILLTDVDGYELRPLYLDISKETRWSRVMKRNDEKGTTFEFAVSRADFDFMENCYEQPTVKKRVEESSLR